MSELFSDKGIPHDQILNKDFVEKLVKNYESLLKNIQDQVDFYSVQHEELRSEIKKVIEENQKLGTHITSITNQPDDTPSRKLATRIIYNLRDQVVTLTEEKRSIENLWRTSQRIIANLETAIREYSRGEEGEGRDSIEQIRRQYTAAIRQLDSNLEELKEKLTTQIAINRNLSQCKDDLKKNFEELSQKYENLLSKQKGSMSTLIETEQSLSVAEKRIEAIMKDGAEMERVLEKSNQTAQEYRNREENALEKMREALQIADEALVEKNEAILRERAIKDECDFLAKTISSVMEDAANKVDQDMDDLRAQCNDKVNSLNMVIESLKVSVKTQIERADIAMARCKNLEAQLKNLLRTNTQLDTDLHVASQTIIEMELKLEALSNIMSKEEESNRACEERAEELQAFLKCNRQIKEKLRETVDDITTKLQGEIKQLKDDNRRLINENVNLKRELTRKI